MANGPPLQSPTALAAAEALVSCALACGPRMSRQADREARPCSSNATACAMGSFRASRAGRCGLLPRRQLDLGRRCPAAVDYPNRPGRGNARTVRYPTPGQRALLAWAPRRRSGREPGGAPMAPSCPQYDVPADAPVPPPLPGGGELVGEPRQRGARRGHEDDPNTAERVTSAAHTMPSQRCRQRQSVTGRRSSPRCAARQPLPSLRHASHQGRGNRRAQLTGGTAETQVWAQRIPTSRGQARWSHDSRTASDSVSWRVPCPCGSERPN